MTDPGAVRPVSAGGEGATVTLGAGAGAASHAATGGEIGLSGGLWWDVRTAPSCKAEPTSKNPLLFNEFDGAPEEIRTPDPQIRSLMLYPAELRARAAGV